MGTTRTDAIKANNCKVGGKVAFEFDPLDETVKRITLNGTNYYNYIYGGSITWEGDSDYDGCTLLTAKPTIAAPTPAE